MFSVQNLFTSAQTAGADDFNIGIRNLRALPFSGKDRDLVSARDAFADDLFQILLKPAVRKIPVYDKCKIH